MSSASTVKSFKNQKYFWKFMIIDLFYFITKDKKYVQSIHPPERIIETEIRAGKRYNRREGEEKSSKYKHHYVEINKKLADKYKERVRDFLVKVTSKPVKLGKYQPPISNIERKSESQKIISNVQLYINGFKSNKERIKVKKG